MSPVAASGTVLAASPTNSSASSRWCPTPEQVMILGELYRSGVRTANASHIQRITAHLSMYGKIEGKNVFYWFQNHKARDRQKLRRKLIKQLHQHQHLPSYDHHQNQYSTNLINNNSFLLNYFGYAPTPSHPPPHRLLHQEGRFGVERGASSSSQVIVERVEANSNGYDDDKQQPMIKTLQLFPVKSTNLKED